MSTPKKGRPLPRSCLICNRRKVKCDRVRPSCTRCNAGGSTCTYSSEDGPTKEAVTIRSSPFERRPIAAADTPVVAHHAPLSILPSPQTPRNATSTQNGNVADSSAIKVQELERKMIQLENMLKRPRESMGEADSSFVDSSSAGQNHDLTDAPSAKRTTKEEPVVKGLLAGKGFKTKYYGASHASSLLAEVGRFSLRQHR